MLYIGVSAIVGLLSPSWQGRILPWVFVLPAIVLLTVYLVYPTIGTIITSFTVQTNGDPLANYKQLTSPLFLAIFRNNIIWLVVGTGGSVLLGLLIAGLFDRVRREALAKTFIFLPLAISFVGASVIWRFMYEWKPEGQPQIGMVNAVWTALGQDPVRWVQEPPINTYALILIFIWLQTGFAMVVLSAAIKGVSTEILEAARLDGASERQIFLRVIVPIIKGSIITVATTIAIVVLKIFDIVYVMTGGRYGTDVVANRMFQEFYQFFNDGRAAALAHGPLPRGAAGHVRQRPQPAPAGSRRMTAPAQTVEAGSDRRAWRPAFLRSAPLRIAVVAICALWTVPTLGLLVTSFRNPVEITTTGWWTALLQPFAADQWTLQNYQRVLSSEGISTPSSTASS